MPQRAPRRREDGETDTLFSHLPFESNYLEDISWDNTTVYGACNNATILSRAKSTLGVKPNATPGSTQRQSRSLGDKPPGAAEP